jgi:hypothetical protein
MAKLSQNDRLFRHQFNVLQRKSPKRLDKVSVRILMRNIFSGQRSVLSRCS